MTVAVGQEFGSLLVGLPAYVSDPPIEAVCFAFGVAEDGQLGLDATGNVLAPKVLEALLGTRLRGRAFGRTPLVAGSRCSVAISADGDVYTWGWNSRASLGQGHRNHVPKPRRVAGLAGVPIVQVALGGWHMLLLDSEGQVWACGGDEYMQCGQAGKERDVMVPTMCLPALRVCQVSAGGMHSLALTEDGSLYAFGEPWGSFSMTIDRRPHRVEVEDPEEIADRGGFVAIACGAFHNLALTATGEIYSFGLNDYGQLGLGHTASVTSPQRIVDGLEGVTVADISCGGWHSACVSTSGEVFMWGRGEYGRLGLGDKSGSSKLRPAKVSFLEGVKIVQVSCGGSHTLCVTADGRAYSFGRGSFGRLGTGEERDAISPVEVKLPGGPERWHVIAIAAGGRHSLCFAVPDNGNLEDRHPLYSGTGDQQRQQRRQQRSPMGLSPQASGIRMNAAAIAAATVSAGGGGDTDGGGADDELSTSPDRESPMSGGAIGSGNGRSREVKVDSLLINIPAPSPSSVHLVHHHHQGEDAAAAAAAAAAAGAQIVSGRTNNTMNPEDDEDGLFEENSLEELIAQAPMLVSSPAQVSATALSAPFSSGTPVESLISQGVATLNIQDQEHQAPYLELSPSKQRTRHSRGGGGGRSGSPKRAPQDDAPENEEEEYGNKVVEPSEHEEESDSEAEVVGKEVRRAASMAKATMHGLRDDILGDNS